MNYPMGGFGAQQPNPQQPPAGSAPSGGGMLALLLKVGVIALGCLTFLLGFAPYAKEDRSGSGFLEDDDSINFFMNAGLGVGTIALALLLVAALVTAFGLLPKQPGNESVAAALSVAGLITLLFLLIGIADGFKAGAGLILALLLAFVQSALAIGSVLAPALAAKAGASPRQGPYPQGGYPMPPPQAPYGAPPAGGAPQQPGGYPQAPQP